MEKFGFESQEEHLLGEEGVEMMKEMLESVDSISLEEFFKTEKGQEFLKSKKIILAGPPQSGKSCLREAIKQSIKNIPLAPYPYVLTACPDGEDSWFQEAVENDPELAARLKAEYKSKFNPEFVKRISNSVENLELPLNFIDIGGIISPENEKICTHANAAVLLSSEKAILDKKPVEWKEFLSKMNIPIVAEIYSDYFGDEDYVKGVDEDQVFRASVHHLERGDSCKDREAVIELAKFIVSLGKDNKKDSATEQVS